MRKVILVRHGAVVGREPGKILGALPYPLSHVGILQAARIVAPIHKEMKVKRVITSPVFRCEQTALFIANGNPHQCGMLENPTLSLLLSEREYGGLVQEKSVYPGIVGEAKWDHNPGLGGESLRDVHTRVKRFAESELMDGDVVVSHELILQFLMAVLVFPYRQHDKYTFNEGEYVTVDTFGMPDRSGS